MACQTRAASFSLTAGEPLMVRETVAMETLARAATVRISGLLGTVVRLPLRLTNLCYLVFSGAPRIEQSFWMRMILFQPLGPVRALSDSRCFYPGGSRGLHMLRKDSIWKAL